MDSISTACSSGPLASGAPHTSGSAPSAWVDWPGSTLHPLQLHPEDGLAFPLRRLLHIHTLGLQLQESLIVGLVAVQLPVIQLHDAVGDAVQKIPVMGDHKQRALKPLLNTPPASPPWRCPDGWWARPGSAGPWAIKDRCQGRTLFLAARQLSDLLVMIRDPQLGSAWPLPGFPDPRSGHDTGSGFP